MQGPFTVTVQLPADDTAEAAAGANGNAVRRFLAAIDAYPVEVVDDPPGGLEVPGYWRIGGAARRAWEQAISDLRDHDAARPEPATQVDQLAADDISPEEQRAFHAVLFTHTGRGIQDAHVAYNETRDNRVREHQAEQTRAWLTDTVEAIEALLAEDPAANREEIIALLRALPENAAP